MHVSQNPVRDTFNGCRSHRHCKSYTPIWHHALSDIRSGSGNSAALTRQPGRRRGGTASTATVRRAAPTRVGRPERGQGESSDLDVVRD